MRCLILGGILVVQGLWGWAYAESRAVLPATVAVSMQGVLNEQLQAQLECVFADLPYTPTFRNMPLARARLNLLQGKVDGYFGITQNLNIAKVAELSAPLLVKQWYRYSYEPRLLDLPVNDPYLRLGVMDSDNPMYWLLEQGIKPAITARSQDQLLQLLDKRRVNQTITDASSLRAVLDGRIPPARRFLRFAALSVYFNRDFLQQHPDFFPAFEQAAESCRVASPQLDSTQREAVLQLASEYFQEWWQQPSWLESLRQAARQSPPSAEALVQADARWLQEQTAEQQPLINQVLATPVAQQLQQAVAQDRRLSEVMLSDKYGQLLAASAITSDFYQGDETAFIQSQTVPENQLLLEPIAYDNSSRQFSVKVSEPLYDPKGGAFLGVLTLAVNIDQLF